MKKLQAILQALLVVLLVFAPRPGSSADKIDINSLPAPSTGSTSLTTGDILPGNRNGITYKLRFNAAGSVSLGTTAASNNPARAGELGTGLYTAGSGLVDIAGGGLGLAEFSQLGVTIGTPTAGVQGYGSINAEGLFVDGVAVVTTAASVTLGTSVSLTNPRKSGDAMTGLYSDGAGLLEVASAGVKQISIGTTGIVVGTATSSFQGTGTINATGLYINGVAVAAGGSGTVASSTVGQIPVYTGATTVTGNTALLYASGVVTIGTTTGTATGKIALTGGTSGVVTIQPQAAAGTYNFNLPTGAGSSGQPLLSAGGGSSPMTFGTLGVAGGGSGLATLTAHSVQIGNGTSAVTQLAVPASGTVLTGVASSDPAFSATPTLGVAGATTGTLALAGSGSGTITIQPQAAAGTYNWNLPVTAGAVGDILTSGGGSSAPMVWVPDVATGQVLISGGVAAAPAYSASPVLTSIGLGTTTVSSAVNITGQAAQTITMVRNVTAATAGQNLTITAGGAVVAGSNLAGGDTIISSGLPTGTGASKIQFKAYAAGSTGTADGTQSTVMSIAPSASGYVGIGTATPLSTLHIQDTLGQPLNIVSTNQFGGGFIIDSTGASGGGGKKWQISASTTNGGAAGALIFYDFTDSKLVWANYPTFVGTLSGNPIGWASASTGLFTALDTGLSRVSAGKVGVGTGGAASVAGTLIAAGIGVGTSTPLATLDTNGTIKTAGYAIASLPAGAVGMRAYVTDQLTVCAATGAALTAGGSVVCPVFYNGSAWVGG